MTYRELLQELQKLSDEKLDQDVTINLTGMSEYLPLTGFAFAVESECDVVDEGHFLLVVED